MNRSTENRSTQEVAAANTGLASSARASLLWGGGFTILRDLAQFAVMLVLVRLLAPSDYGTAALAQAVVGLVSVVSYATFSLQALQVRDPSTIDWQAHFTVAAAINILMCALVLVLAWGLSFTGLYRDVAPPLAALAVSFLVEIPGTLRHRMLETRHDWKRFRVLLMIGTLLALGTGLVVGMMGGGVWALIVQGPILGLPAAFDLMVLQRFRPRWTFNPAAWREIFRFGFDRAASASVERGRALNEQAYLSGVYDLATLGVFTRANGLATLLAGRIGSVVPMALHPVVTRAERASPRFQRLADLVLRGVCWTTMPITVFLAVGAQDAVQVLYGPKWGPVISLLPLAAVVTGIVGVWNALSSMLLANGDSRLAMWLGVFAALSAIVLAIAIIPHGLRIYLAGLALLYVTVAGITAAVLIRQHAMTSRGVVLAISPAFASGLAAGAVVLAVNGAIGTGQPAILRLTLDGLILATVYLGTLRLMFRCALSELLEVVPAGRFLARSLRLSTRRIA